MIFLCSFLIPIFVCSMISWFFWLCFSLLLNFIWKCKFKLQGCKMGYLQLSLFVRKHNDVLNNDTNLTPFKTHTLLTVICNADQRNGLRCMDAHAWYEMSDIVYTIAEARLDEMKWQEAECESNEWSTKHDCHETKYSDRTCHTISYLHTLLVDQVKLSSKRKAEKSKGWNLGMIKNNWEMPRFANSETVDWIL